MAEESKLHKKMKYLESVPSINRCLERIVSGDDVSPADVRSYFKNNHAAYKRVHSKEGFMHFRISQNGMLSDEDLYYQPNTVSKYIKDGDSVVELGPGMGSNLLYLAKKHPTASFTGVDLFPKPIADMPSNVRIIEHDYSDMSMIPDASADVVFGIETIVHCQDKTKVYKEVYRILKPGGVFIVYDYALRQAMEKYDDVEKKAIMLVSKGGGAALLESKDEWEAYFDKGGFTKESVNNLTKNTLPDLKRLSTLASHTLEVHPVRGLPARFCH